MTQSSPASWTLRIAIGLPVLLGALDLTVISATLPVIVDELGLALPEGTRQAAWLVSGYLIAYAVGILGAGRLGDAVGEKRTLIVAVVVFGLASALVAGAGAWSTGLVQDVAYRWFEARPGPDRAGLWVLVAGRALQALGAGAMVPVGMSFGWRLTGHRSWLGFIAAADMAGWTLGHLYGGIIVTLADWQAAFWINVPLCVVALVMLARTLDPPQSPRRAFPVVQFALGAAGLALLVYGTAGEEADRLIQPGSVAVGVAALVVSAALGSDDLLPLRSVLRRPAATASNFVLGYLVFLTLAFVPLYVSVLFDQGSQQDAWTTGWLLSAFTLPLVASTWLGTRSSSRWLLPLGALGASAGFLMMRAWEPESVSLVPSLVLVGLSLGVFFAPLAEHVLVAVPERAAGAASSLVILTRLVGMAIGTSVLTGYILRRVGQANVTDAASLLVEVESAFQQAAYLGAAGAVLLGVLALARVAGPAGRS